LTQLLADQLSCHAYLLPAQSIERSVEDRRRLLNSGEVAEVVAKFGEVDVALVGIGALEPSQLLMNSGNYYQEDMLRLLAGRGAVGDICLHYFNAQGDAVLADDEDPVIGMPLPQVRECTRVVALAGGSEKVAAIKGALEGRYIDVLITDRLVAEHLA
jgi:DNA-binding transcriptional regulator LsrR (DeoR family)